MSTLRLFDGITAAEVARVLEAVLTCPDRGSVFPNTSQPECGCAELTACRAGRGRDGAVTLEDCVRCRAAALGIGLRG
jgi:hypothetical protein